jgi:hypothetical protein
MHFADLAKLKGRLASAGKLKIIFSYKSKKYLI